MKKSNRLIFICIAVSILVSSITLVSSYNERFSAPQMTDNAYSLAVSSFIKEKIGDSIAHKDVMIVGDDFVVPGYRNSIPMSEGFSAFGIVDWFENQKNIKINTDIGYIKNSYPLTISDIDQLEDSIYFVLPENVNSGLLNSIRDLEQVLIDKFSITISEIEGNQVNCNDIQYFDRFNDKSLFIIGTKNENQALNCYPFVELEENQIIIQPNVWDTSYILDDEKSFAVIISSTNATVIDNVNYMIDTGLYADIKTQSAIIDYTLMGVGVIGTGAVIIGSVTVGSPVIVVGGAILATISITNECVIKNAGGDNWGWCGAGAILDLGGGTLINKVFQSAKPIAKWTVKNTIGKVGDNLILKFGDKFLEFAYNLIKKGKYKEFVKGLDVIYKHGSKSNINAIFEYYDDDVAEVVFESAGKYMDESVKLANLGKFAESNNKGFFIAKEQSILNHIEDYGTNGRIFVAELDTKWIDKSRLNDINYVREIEGKLGLPKNLISNGDSIMIVEIDNIKSKFIGDGIPKKGDSTLSIFLPESGSTIGGVPERVIKSQNLEDIYELQKNTNIFSPR